MRRSLWRVAGLVVALACAATHPALAAKRLALLVGNNAYQEVPALQTAVNDVRAAKAALERLGYQVELVENGTKRQIGRALARVESAVEPGDSVVFHFAGHGFEIDGQNWLLPVDVPAARQGEAGLVKDESFDAAAVVERFRAKGAGTVVAILDACRDNPFAGGGTRSLGGTRGLARMDAAGGVFILFSAGAKQQALDRLGDADPVGTSIFARTFVPLLGDGRLTLIDLAKETQERVRAMARTVGHEQLPAYYDGVVGRITVTGEVATETAQPRMQAVSEAPAVTAEDRFWRSVETGNDAASYRAYLQEVERGVLPGTYRRLAELRLAALAQPRPVDPPQNRPADPVTPRTASVTAPAVQPTSIPVEASGGDVEACDRAAAEPGDKERPANLPGVLPSAMDAPTAIAVCRRAAELLNAPRRTSFQLGRAYKALGAQKEASEYFARAAEKGHVRAQGYLGGQYEYGRGVPKNYLVAIVFYERAAEAGDTDALAALADIHEKGRGVPVNYRMAAAFYEKAATLGNVTAIHNLGVYYERGTGVPRDRARACQQYALGAKLGNANSVKGLKNLRCG